MKGFLLADLNRCHLDLSELNRLIQRLQALEVGQAFTNGDLQKIISTQVDGRGARRGFIESLLRSLCE